MIQLDKRHYQLIDAILRRYPYQFWVYGSRSTGKARPFSDLDLCVKGDASLAVLGQIQAEFEESDLPFKVGLIAWNLTSKEFLQQIQPDLQPWPESQQT